MIKTDLPFNDIPVISQVDDKYTVYTFIADITHLQEILVSYRSINTTYIARMPLSVALASRDKIIVGFLEGRKWPL